MNNDSTASRNWDDDENEQGGGFSFDLTELKAMVYRQRIILLPIFVGALLIGLIVSLLMTPIYQASVTVQIETGFDNIVDDGDIEQKIRGGDVQRYLNTQVQILKSRKMAQRVSKQLRLETNDNFLVAMDIEPITEVDKGQNVTLVRRAQVISALTKNVDISLPFGSIIATISFSSPSKKMAADVANAYAENLITGNIEQRYEATSYARDFLEQEIADARRRLEDSELQAIAYARNTQIIDASDGIAAAEGSSSPKSITTANLVQTNSDLSSAKTERIRAEEKWRHASRTPLFSLSEVLNNPTIQQLQSEKARKEAGYRELLDRYKPDYPTAKEARAEVSALDGEIIALARTIRNSIRNEFEVARRQEASLARSVGALKADTLNEQNKRVRLNTLARDVDTDRSQYQALLERFKAVSTAADVVTNNVSILDRAQGVKKIAPRPLVNVALAGFVGAFFALMAAFIRETFDDSVRSPDDVSRKLGLPLLGTTPTVKLDSGIITTLSDRKSAIAEAYSSIRSSLDFSTRNGAPSSVLITSSQPSEGKSTSAIALADSFGRTGKRVLLVDSDLRNPSLHQYLDRKNNGGLVAVLTGNSKLENQAQRYEGMNFDFLSCGPIPPDPAEIIVSETIARFLTEYSAGYDIIIFDGPPVMGLADSPQISRSVEGTIMVVEAGRIHGGQTKTAIRRLQHAEAHVLGIVLSKFDGDKEGYGKYYGNQYYYNKVQDKG